MLSNPVLSAVNVPLMLYNSLPIFRRAWHVPRDEKRMNIDFLDTLAILASIGQNMMVTGGIIVWLIRLGDWIRDMTAAGSRKAIDELLEFQGKTAWQVVDGQVVSVPVNQIQAGDPIQMHHGEMIPVDGTIVKDRAMVDQKTITGEGLPVTRSDDEAAFAGTIVKEGQLVIRADRVGTETMAAQIAKLVSEAPIGDTRMQNHAEKFADRLVAPTLGLAVGTAAAETKLKHPVAEALRTKATEMQLVLPECERVAASAVPIAGAIGGATVNVVFTRHYQQLARGHFAVRALERRYGYGVVQGAYDRILVGGG
jgi:Cu2+-exporting ATPase